MSDMKENLELLSRSLYRLPVAELTDEQLHAVVARAVLARLQPAWQGSLQAHCAGRRAYYFSAEYLLGKAVYPNGADPLFTDVPFDDGSLVRADGSGAFSIESSCRVIISGNSTKSDS